MQGQPQTVTAAAYQFTPAELQKLRYIYNLGITETVLGILSILCGILLLLFGISIAEGLWCGIFIVLAGGFGISAGKPTATKCTHITHLVFAILGAIFAGLMFIFSLIYTLAFWTTASFAFHIILDLVAFAALIVQIVSASFCCCVRGGGCAQAYGANTSAQVVIVQQQVPGVAPQPGMYQQQPPMYAGQQQPVGMYPAAQQQPVGMYPAAQQQPVGMYPAAQQEPLVQDEKAGGIPSAPGPTPPTYS